MLPQTDDDGKFYSGQLTYTYSTPVEALFFVGGGDGGGHHHRA
ncbi:MAG TPA: hypothetical protein VFS97_01725 [Nitrososphaeraceae archaeon]|nr:hypothetical protein [Nitrososphaeraceae archaeon]